MKDFVIKCPKGQGIYAGNFLRSLAYSSVVTWQPIGILLDTPGVSLLSIGDEFAEDLATCADNLIGYTFSAVNENVSDDLLVDSYTFKSELSAEILANGKIVKATTNGPTVLHRLKDDPINISIYYRKACGNHSAQDNTNFLNAKLKFFNSKIKVLSSMHLPVRVLTYQVKEKSYDEEELIFHVDALDGKDLELLQKTIKQASLLLNNLSNNFKVDV